MAWALFLKQSLYCELLGDTGWGGELPDFCIVKFRNNFKVRTEATPKVNPLKVPHESALYIHKDLRSTRRFIISALYLMLFDLTSSFRLSHNINRKTGKHWNKRHYREFLSIREHCGECMQFLTKFWVISGLLAACQSAGNPEIQKKFRR